MSRFTLPHPRKKSPEEYASTLVLLDIMQEALQRAPELRRAATSGEMPLPHEESVERSESGFVFTANISFSEYYDPEAFIRAVLKVHVSVVSGDMIMAESDFYL